MKRKNESWGWGGECKLAALAFVFFVSGPQRLKSLVEGDTRLMIRRHELTEPAPASYDLEMFFDGDCPLCAKEVAWLRRLDRRQRIRFIDIAGPEFDAEVYGKTFDELMSQMHARRSDGVWLTGVEVFRQLYASVGYRWLVAPTRLPGISWVLDCGYAFFAKHRLRLTGRCSSGTSSCATGACQIPSSVDTSLTDGTSDPNADRKAGVDS